jgi:hypothetical protein
VPSRDVRKADTSATLPSEFLPECVSKMWTSSEEMFSCRDCRKRLSMISRTCKESRKSEIGSKFSIKASALIGADILGWTPSG